jgi:hypothetical protein
MRSPVIIVGELLTGTIRSGGNGRFAFATADYFDIAMIDCDVNSPFLRQYNHCGGNCRFSVSAEQELWFA